MTTRNLTDSFIFMRNNSLQNRQYYEENVSDKAALLKNKSNDLESGETDDLPPEYKLLVKNIQYDFTKIQQKMKNLISLHDRHLNRASLDDNIDEDRKIEAETKELTDNFVEVHRKLTQLSAAGRKMRLYGGSKSNIAANVQANKARQLMDLSVAFRKAQSLYLGRLKSRDDRLKGFFEIPSETISSGGDIVDDSDGLPDYLTRRQNQEQQQILVEENSQAVREREREINEIVRSIHELNGIFRDISQLVTDQGSVVDRIDHNVETTQLRVRDGLHQIQKAHKYQKKNRKMLIIIVLSVLACVLTIVLVVTKFSSKS